MSSKKETPAVPTPEEIREQEKADREQKRLNAKFATRSLLIAEDNADLRAALTEAAEERGFKVYVAIDGAEALRKAQFQHFDALLVDMNLPKKLGHEVVTEIRQGGPCQASVIVVLSGYLKKEIVQALAGKVEKAFTKPADIEAVIEALAALVEKSPGAKKAG